MGRNKIMPRGFYFREGYLDLLQYIKPERLITILRMLVELSEDEKMPDLTNLYDEEKILFKALEFDIVWDDGKLSGLDMMAEVLGVYQVKSN